MSDSITIGLGEVLWDMFPSGKVLGGAPSNFAYHLNSLGINCIPVSSVGSDSLGEEIISSLTNKSLSIEYIQVNPNYNTGVVEVKVDNEGKPSYIIKENVAWDNIEFDLKLKNLTKRCSAVCFGSLAQRSEISRNTIKKFLTELPDDSLKVFDINLRQNFYSKSLIVQSLKCASALKLNDDELNIIGGILELEGSDEFLISHLMDNYNLCLITLTKGDKGSLIITPKEESFREPEKVEIIDTVGAGDAFTAGLVYGLLKKYDLQKTHLIANRLASYVCTQAGATPEISTELKNEIINY